MSELRENIIKHIKAKGNYDPLVDDFFVDELISNIELAQECLTKIKATGGVSENYFYKPGHSVTRINPLVAAYQMFQRNIHQSASKLGISRSDRIKFKLLVEKLDDFDDDENEK